MTDENLVELVRLTNEDLAQQCEVETGKLDIIKSELEDVESRLVKLYEALGTAEFKGGELAPRFKALFEKKAELQQAKSGAEDAVKYQAIKLASPTVVKDYVQSLRDLLEESSIVSKKVFLRSFIERIEVDEKDVKVIYAMPVPPDTPPIETVGVLPFVHDGPPYCTIDRTDNKYTSFNRYLYSKMEVNSFFSEFTSIGLINWRYGRFISESDAAR